MLRFVSSLSTVSRETGGQLGGALVGVPASGAVPPWPVQRVFAPLLGSTSPVVHETWLVDGPLTSGRGEDIHWRRNGGLLYGVIDLDEVDFRGGPDCSPLQAASAEAYRRIFRLLDAQGVPHLWRAWNYLPRINLETHGLERYRQFNIGRQDAFVDCHRSSTGNVPAACAIGLVGGTLSIAFLAGEVPAVPIENPRQISAYNYPADYGPRSPTFSRATLARIGGQELLFISGTASIVGHQTVHSGDAAGQCRESLANIAAVVTEASRQAQRAFVLPELSYRVYIRNAGDFPAVRAVMEATVGAAEIVYLQADICRADLLLEIEAYASHLQEN